jgi:hypothetical protein
MFTATPDTPACLRQGDIIADVFFPLPRFANTKVLSSYTSGRETEVTLSAGEVYLEPIVETPEGAKRSYVSGVVQGFFAHAAVLSQCCDCDRKRPKPSFLLCRILLVDEKRFHNIENLRANVDPYDASTKPHFQFFYYGTVPELAGECIADYAHVFAVPWADYNVILNRKRFQLNDIDRNKFRVKAGAWFGRPPDEDVKLGLTDPWHPTTSGTG